MAHANLQTADGMVLYLQGGPGFGAPVPGVSLGVSATSSWAGAALWAHSYQRVVLMDQRGTGQSTPVTKQTLQQQFPDLFLLDDDVVADHHQNEHNSLMLNSRRLSDLQSTTHYAKVQDAVAQVTQYLSQFRADHIVADAEYIREALMAPAKLDETPEQSVAAAVPDSASPQLIRPWGCCLGQSFGGFCSMTYMSTIAHPPRIMLLTGGIAPMLDTNVVSTYRALWEQCRERNYRYYEMYPSDVALVRTIVQRLLLSDNPVMLPSGGRLTARRFLSLGIGLGGSPSAFASLHNFLSTALVGGGAMAVREHSNHISDLTFTRAFLKRMDTEQSFDDHPIYFWLHESIYADGPDTNCPTNWAAHRAYEQLVQEQPNVFDYRRTSSLANTDDDHHPTLFFGEHVFPWMPEDYVELNGVGLRAVADALAHKSDWGPLYNATHMRMVHATGRTRSAAAVYVEDMYVNYDSCRRVAARDGPLGQCRLYVTNEYQHSGLRDNGAVLFSKLHGMAKGGTRTPS